MADFSACLPLPPQHRPALSLSLRLGPPCDRALTALPGRPPTVQTGAGMGGPRRARTGLQQFVPPPSLCILVCRVAKTPPHRENGMR